jgi:hypothetical protein
VAPISSGTPKIHHPSIAAILSVGREEKGVEIKNAWYRE